VRHSRPGLATDDRARANRILLDPVLFPEEDVAVTLEDDEDLLSAAWQCGGALSFPGNTSAWRIPVFTEPSSRPG
jgi:hypothetical protein